MLTILHKRHKEKYGYGRGDKPYGMRGSLFIPPDISTRYGYIQHIPNGIVRALPLRSKSLNIL